MQLTTELAYDRLRTVIDPELGINIVSLGLIYDVQLSMVQTPEGEQQKVHVLMTLTTPGCPLIHVFEKQVREVFADIAGIQPYRDVTLELTFDPPWIPDMMDEESRAELGF